MTIVDASELGALDAVETARRVRDGELKASEVIAAAIGRARTLNPALNAIPTEDYAAAVALAEKPRPGPFAGVPTFVKALDNVAGQVNDQGSRVLQDNVARGTEPYVARMLDTGLVSLGRSAAPEIGLNATTEPLAHGPTRNPWNVEYGTGGSSGGAAALVAARIVPLAHGSDAAGSIRIPSSACGLVGLKPSRERGFSSTLANLLPVRIFTYGALTRSVRDSAHFIAAMEERSPRGKLPSVGLVDGPAKKRLRIGLYSDSPLGQEVDPEVREVTFAAGRACADLGHHVEEIACPYEGRILDDVWIYIGYLAFAVMLQTRMSLHAGQDVSNFEPWTRGLAAYYKKNWTGSIGVIRRLRAASRTSTRLFGKYDALLCPTLSTPAPRIGDFAPDRPFDEVFSREKEHICFTPIQNVTGDPAISLPMGSSASGLPVGVQFAAAPGGEAMLLALSYELEAAQKYVMLGRDDSFQPQATTAEEDDVR